MTSLVVKFDEGPREAEDNEELGREESDSVVKSNVDTLVVGVSEGPGEAVKTEEELVWDKEDASGSSGVTMLVTDSVVP